MTVRATAISSPSASIARISVARLRVPGFLPAGLPDRPGRKRPPASRAAAIARFEFSMTHSSYDQISPMYVRIMRVSSGH
jgi:hypothetical protein